MIEGGMAMPSRQMLFADHSWRQAMIDVFDVS